MRYVVTGGAGFIGSHIVDRLLADEHDVAVIDSFVSGRRENLVAHAENRRLRVVDADVASSDLNPTFEEADAIFHLAALADIVPSIEDPIAYYRANVEGTIRVLEAARQTNVPRVVYAASSSCYGLAREVPTPESAEVSPQYPYALTKRLGEELVLHWGKVYGLGVLSLRLFNVYGPRARTSGTYGAVFGVFLAQKLAGKPFTVVGDGTQGRDFTFVEDVADAFVRAAASNLRDEVFNVGTGEPQTVNRLVELLGGEVVYVPKRPGEPDVTHADAGKIRAALGWRPRTTFEQGVAIMLQNIDAWRDAPVWNEAAVATATASWFRYLGAQKERP